MTKRIFLLIAICYLPIAAFSQGACYPAGVVLLDTGRPANGASVRVCTSGSTGTPCTPAASLFTDPTLGTPLGGSPTVTTDAHGNFGFCAAAGVNYDLQITGTGITPLTIKNLPLPPTSPITAASLTSSSANPANVGQIKLASGDCLDWRNNANSGNIQLCKNASDQLDLTAFASVLGVSAMNGVAFPASPSTHSVPVITAANTAAYKVVPDCTDTTGNHINYTQSTDSFSCGTTVPASVVTLSGVQTLPNKTLATPVQGIACAGICVPVVVGYARQVSQTAAISATTLFTTGGADTVYIVSLGVTCRSASASATVIGNITWTDISGTVYTAPTTTANCNTLAVTAQGSENNVIQVKAGTNVQYSTTISNTPTYDVRVAVTQLGTN